MWIGKTYKIDAAHHIPNHPKCGNKHGHTYYITISLEGRIQHDGFVIDFGKLDSIVKPILDLLDHNDLNTIIHNPTCENIALYLCKELIYKVPNTIREVKIHVKEGDGGWAEVHHLHLKE